MIKNLKKDISCNQNHELIHEYTHLQVFINNLPYMIMAVIGGIIILLSYKISFIGWILSGSYLLYSIIGAVWIILFICPHCHYYNTRACPCGYGQISSMVRKKGNENLFREKFNKHILFIIPLWIIPVIAVIIFLINNYTLLLLVLIIIFGINSFVILPLLSKKYGCSHCPQKENCPWMKSKSN